jgi:hypothetical protein
MISLKELMEKCDAASPEKWEFVGAPHPETVRELCEAIQSCIEALEGTFGQDFWKSELGKKLRKVICE